MKLVEFELPRPDITLRGSAWIPENPKCVVLIEHGMADHHRRYVGFAEHLATLGMAVYGYDQRGHGRTAGPPESPEFAHNAGWLAEKNGWQHLVDDSLAMINWILAGGVEPLPIGQKTMPLFLFGHSMGSFLVRSVLVAPGFPHDSIAGCILSGTAGPTGFMGSIGAVLTAAWVRLHGAHTESPFLNKLFLGSYSGLATGLSKPRTVFEWISSDSNQVDEYIADPYCGMVMRTSFYRDLIGGLASLFRPSYRGRFPLDIPLLMVSGEQDPVGGMGKGVRRVYADYVAWGVQDVHMRLYEGGRHEMLHEKNFAEVHKMISDWVLGHLATVKN